MTAFRNSVRSWLKKRLQPEAVSQGSHGNSQTGELEEGVMHVKEALAVHDQSLKLAHPGKGAFDFPSPSGSPQASPVLGRRFPPIATMRKDQLNAPPLEPRSRRIAVVGAVSNEPLRSPLPVSFTVYQIQNAYHSNENPCGGL
jgi:hypothetical protein